MLGDYWGPISSRKGSIPPKRFSRKRVKFERGITQELWQRDHVRSCTAAGRKGATLLICSQSLYCRHHERGHFDLETEYHVADFFLRNTGRSVRSPHFA